VEELSYRVVIKRAKKIIGTYSESVPIKSYLFMVREYKRSCRKITYLIKKDRDKNHKIVEIQRKYKEEISALKREIKKYKTMLSEKEEQENFILKDDINQITSQHFSNEDRDKLLSDVVFTLSKTVLNFSKVDIRFFEDNKIILLQRAIFKKVKLKIGSDSSNVVAGVTNTILRDNFKHIHKEFARKVLEASDVDKGVFKFFGDVAVYDEDGIRWNSSAITRFMHDYLRSIRIIERLNHDIVQLTQKSKEYESIEDDLEMDIDEYNERFQEREKADKLLDVCRTKIVEEEKKLSDLEIDYNNLLKAVTKTLLQTKILHKS
jgi:predicted RNase H-like nuclease (RuvC/YqgF family)